WRIIDNSIQPQNRLRWKEYLDMYGSVGLPITEEETRKGNLDLLKKVDIHPEFESFSLYDLAISHGYIVSKC
ncbi:MAG: class I SAM-dependent methyltransferase, partial [Flavobacteriales bacterium]|nr:class I SAM-dependent methyltransferase [Flavobacteriales bacterium]